MTPPARTPMGTLSGCSAGLYTTNVPVGEPLGASRGFFRVLKNPRRAPNGTGFTNPKRQRGRARQDVLWVFTLRHSVIRSSKPSAIGRASGGSQKCVGTGEATAGVIERSSTRRAAKRRVATGSKWAPQVASKRFAAGLPRRRASRTLSCEARADAPDSGSPATLGNSFRTLATSARRTL